MPLYVLVPLAAAIAVIGYYLPLLGIPLAAFLAVDIAAGEIARGRATTPAA
ncbi:propeptide PepSY amd peptidase M4 [Streptomyces malaysiensis]|uniref:Propeptide PepSY amd peptidase M4 n=1 Tax=Streptomyces malaysiensis TaxID=92644 RepID=A0A7X6AUY9_STRMQ|nr:propeptide PepSY amd peptidase M4 [Streptomyces malaysiensis]